MMMRYQKLGDIRQAADLFSRAADNLENTGPWPWIFRLNVSHFLSRAAGFLGNNALCVATLTQLQKFAKESIWKAVEHALPALLCPSHARMLQALCGEASSDRNRLLEEYQEALDRKEKRVEIEDIILESLQISLCPCLPPDVAEQDHAKPTTDFGSVCEEERKEALQVVFKRWFDDLEKALRQVVDLENNLSPMSEVRNFDEFMDAQAKVADIIFVELSESSIQIELKEQHPHYNVWLQFRTILKDSLFDSKLDDLLRVKLLRRAGFLCFNSKPDGRDVGCHEMTNIQGAEYYYTEAMKFSMNDLDKEDTLTRLSLIHYKHAKGGQSEAHRLKAEKYLRELLNLKKSMKKPESPSALQFLVCTHCDFMALPKVEF